MFLDHIWHAINTISPIVGLQPCQIRTDKAKGAKAGGHPCVADPLPDHYQAAVGAATAAGAPVGPALRAWESELPLSRS